MFQIIVKNIKRVRLNAFRNLEELMRTKGGVARPSLWKCLRACASKKSLRNLNGVLKRSERSKKIRDTHEVLASDERDAGEREKSKV